MGKKDFDEFLNKLGQEKDANKHIDWKAKRDEWIAYLDEFYKTVEEFLSEYLESGKINYEYSEKKIIEDYIGEYSVKVLQIKFGPHTIKLEPIGTNLIGAKGRVDLMGANGKVKFVLVDKSSSGPRIKMTVWVNGEKPPEKEEEKKDIEWGWKIATPPPSIKYIDLQQDTFFDSLMEVAGG